MEEEEKGAEGDETTTKLIKIPKQKSREFLISQLSATQLPAPPMLALYLRSCGWAGTLHSSESVVRVGIGEETAGKSEWLLIGVSCRCHGSI